MNTYTVYKCLILENVSNEMTHLQNPYYTTYMYLLITFSVLQAKLIDIKSCPVYFPYSKWAVYEGRESATLISIHYKHPVIQTDDSAMTTLGW